MLKKIVSGGQIGAEQAALDVAIKLGIPHGGWIQKGRRTQSWTLPEKYKLEEMTSPSHKKRIEQNVIDSDGTLILSHGKLAGGADYGEKMALEHQRPLLHVDLAHLDIEQAAGLIRSWREANRIEVLYVTGSLSSEDARIYKDTLDVLENALSMGPSKVKTISIDSLKTPPAQEKAPADSAPPKTVEEAADQLIAKIPLRDRTVMANLTRDELGPLNLSLGTYIINEFFQKGANKELIRSCCAVSGNNLFIESGAAFFIIRKVWEKLQKTHRLRVVK